jgi:hypothetical protein
LGFLAARFFTKKGIAVPGTGFEPATSTFPRLRADFLLLNYERVNPMSVAL